MGRQLEVGEHGEWVARNETGINESGEGISDLGGRVTVGDGALIAEYVLGRVTAQASRSKCWRQALDTGLPDCRTTWALSPQPRASIQTQVTASEVGRTSEVIDQMREYL